MDPKEKLIITKLLSLAVKQQKILTKLAQTAPVDHSLENSTYLKQAWLAAALNSGVEQVTHPNVSYTPAAQVDGMTVSEKYIVSGPIAAKYRDLMLRNLQNQIRLQKEELDGKVSIIFNDPATPV